MTAMWDIKSCRNCGQEIQLVPVIGWAHVDVLANLDCEARA